MDDQMQEIIGLLAAIFIIIAINLGLDALSNYLMRRRMEELQNGTKKEQWKKAAKAFGVKVKDLKKMDKEEIKKRFRKMAMKAHPDHGGNAEDFRNLNSAYKFAYAA